jgi:hypothetical protein
VAPLPHSIVWPIPPLEPEPQAKERAVRLVEALTSWSMGQSGEAAAVARLATLRIPTAKAAELAASAESFLGSAAEATSTVISAQYGGLTATQASILITFRQWTRGPDGAVIAGGSAADARLDLGGTGWVVTQLNPAQPDPALAAPSDLVRQVLGHPKIHLPPSAVADIAAGNLRPKPMQAMLDLAGTYEIDVSIVFSAHPTNVFATDRLSDHTRRRAFDVWAINGQSVIGESTPDALVDGFLRDAVDAGAYNVGGPRQLSGSAFFSDRTHRDHTHIAFRTDT